MTVRVGVVGTGMIGRDHVLRLSNVLAGAEVVAVTDVDPDNAAAAVADLPRAVVHPDGQALVDAPDVDAVIVASWGPTHEEYVLACLAAGKPVFCEKPLATSQEACRRILDAEVAVGRRLVQVGFMRRYDPAYRAMKDVVTSGAIGAPLLVHSRHRNPSVPSHYVREMAITDSAVHDFDIVRWLLDEDFVSATVLAPSAQPARHRPPGPAAHHPAHRQRRAGGRGDVGQQQVRLRRRRGGRGGGRHRRPGRHQPGGRAPRGWVRGRGAGGLARAVRARVRRRAAGLGGRAGRRARCDRAELLGRLRSRRRVRRRRGGPAHRRHGGVPARPAHRRSTPTGRADDRSRGPRGPDRGAGRCRPVPGAARPARRRPHVREVPRRHGDQRGRRGGPAGSPDRGAHQGRRRRVRRLRPDRAGRLRRRPQRTSARPPTCTRRSCSAS